MTAASPSGAPAAQDGATAFPPVFAAEKACIDKQRALRDDRTAPQRYVGLALSGGGVRSASFAIGVLQGLNAEGRLKQIDYLSTVSGGGYAGALLTWFNFLLRNPPPPPFPLGQKYRAARSHATDGATGQARAGSSAQADMLAFIRQHGRYLSPARNLNVMALIATVLRNVVVCFSIYFSGLVALNIGLLHLWSESGALTALFHELPGWLQRAGPFWWVALIGLLGFALSLLFGVATWLFSFFSPGSTLLYAARTQAQVILGYLLAALLIFLVCGSVQYVYGLIRNTAALSGSLSVSSIVGLAGVVWEFYRQQRPAVKVLRITAAMRVIITAAALIYALLIGAYAVAVNFQGIPNAGWYTLGFFLVFGFFVNSNMFGIGRMYRDRLMEAFMPDINTVQGNEWRPAKGADVTFLSQVSTPQDVGPYHLVNAHVVLPDTRYARFRNRGGDNFVMSHLYCGGDAIGWHPTSQFCGGSMSLATAIAISGAAVNPNAACGGRGVSRDMFVSFMLALFNIRLGYWVRNPRLRSTSEGFLRRLWPNLLHPGLRQGLLGAGLHRGAMFLELTDGGHFDNTGIYELVRRGVDTIVLSLASADPEFSLADLANVIERVRADFGVYVDFRAAAIEQLLPGSDADAIGLPGAKLQIAKQGYAIAAIKYAPNHTGTLVVLKSTVVRDLPLDVYGYGARNKPFPNESTADQFFGEEQFEAYRELGYYITQRALDDDNAEAWFK